MYIHSAPFGTSSFKDLQSKLQGIQEQKHYEYFFINKTKTAFKSKQGCGKVYKAKNM